MDTEVILQSLNLPHLNGEYTVTKILREGEVTVCHVTGFTYTKGCIPKADYIYVLNGLSKDNCMSDGVTRKLEIPWYEQALRKKHNHSEDSFQEMISKLKRTQKLSQ